MIAARRTRWNFALQRAVEQCVELGKPLVILEPLDVDYPWASDRLHRFVLDGMAATAGGLPQVARALLPLRRASGRTMAGACCSVSHRRACIVITDHYPAFFIPRLLQAAARASAVRVEAVDSNGLIPLATHGRAFTSARSFRAFVQRELRPHLREFPEEHPLRRLPRRQAQVDAEDPAAMAGGHDGCSSGPRHSSNCQSTTPFLLLTRLAASGRHGGVSPTFVKSQLGRYAAEHNDPDADCTSRLSPVPALRPHLGARGVLRGDDGRALDDPPAGGAGRRRTRRLVGCERQCQRVSRSAHGVARARLQRLRMGAGLQRATNRCRSGRATRSRRTARSAAASTTSTRSTPRRPTIPCGTPRSGS